MIIKELLNFYEWKMNIIAVKGGMYDKLVKKKVMNLSAFVHFLSLSFHIT